MNILSEVQSIIYYANEKYFRLLLQSISVCDQQLSKKSKVKIPVNYGFETSFETIDKLVPQIGIR